MLDVAPPGKYTPRELAVAHRMHLAWVRYRLGEYRVALRLLEEALSAAHALGLRSLEAEIELRRGPTLARLSDHSAAERATRNALALAQETRNAYIEAAALGNIGFNLMQLGREDEAIPFFERTLALAERTQARSSAAKTLGNLGRCYLSIGDVDRAIDFLTRAEAAASKLGDTNAAQIWTGVLGEVHWARHDYKAAGQYYRRALELSRATGNTFETASQLRHLANLSLDAGNAAEAERYTAEAVELCRGQKMPSVLPWMEIALARIAAARGRMEEAITGFKSALRDSGNVYAQAHWSALVGLAEAHAKIQRWADAASGYEAALAEIEANRAKLAAEEWKLTFQDSVLHFYQSYVEFLMGRGRVDRALEVAEASRARLLAHALRLDSKGLDIVTAAQMRESARASGAALVSFWLAPKRSYVWVVTRSGVRSAEMPPDTVIRDAVEDYQAAIERGRDPLASDHPAGLALSDKLLAPVTRLANGARRFVVVPHGALHRLNLEALPAPGAPPHYWIEDASVAVAPSLALLSREAAPVRKRETMLVIGNPVVTAEEFPLLPAAREEIAAIRKRFESAVYEGAAADAGAYREAGPARFSLIHFAAHATANHQSPLDSAVILSPRNGRYKLYAREVMQSPIGARVVTISSCRGAGARVYTGEGLVGFAWAFLHAGAENVVAGLWDVNDSSTAALMDRFYARLSVGEPPASALRAAKLEMLRSNSAWRKPYYWAPFEVMSRVVKIF